MTPHNLGYHRGHHNPLQSVNSWKSHLCRSTSTLPSGWPAFDYNLLLFRGSSLLLQLLEKQMSMLNHTELGKVACKTIPALKAEKTLTLTFSFSLMELH